MNKAMELMYGEDVDEDVVWQAGGHILVHGLNPYPYEIPEDGFGMGRIP